MRRVLWLLVPLMVLAGCADGERPAATRAVTATVTATATVTETVTATPSPSEPPKLVFPGATRSPGPSEPARRPLRLTVFSDGCGVIRSDSTPGDYRNLTWTFRDADGFQVLGRNAEGETRYRYFRPGAYTVVLEAWGTTHYVPVSNEVTVHC